MMPSPEQQAELRTCTLAGSGLTVEFSADALREILTAALDGFLSFPFGGLEVGGVLFGVREGNLLRVVTSRPVACEHSFGPGYTLSERDQEGLRQLLEDAADPSLAGLAPLGWYHSHTRGGLALSAADVELHDRYFPQSWQVAMVLLPRYSKPTRIGLFGRAADGALPAAPEFEFESGPAAVGRPPGARERATVAEAPAVEPPPEAPGVDDAATAETPVPETEVLPEVPPEGTGSRRRWIWAALAALLLLLGGGLFLPGLWRKAPPAAPLSLRLIEKNGRLDIQWDAGSPIVRQAQRGTLEITDGLAEVAFPLDAKLLKLGSWSMLRQSGEVQVRLEVEAPGREPVEESAHFVGPPPKPMAVTEAPGMPVAKEAAPVDVAKVRSELETRLKELQRQPAPAAAPAPAAVSPPKPKPRKAFRVPAWSARRGPAATLGAPEPVEGLLAQAAPPLQTARLPEPPAPPPPATTAPPKPEPPPPSQGYQGPKSGRLIWTGFLPRNGVLTIEKGAASSGHVSGNLPGVPCRVGASPAEFTAGGLTVYSANPRFERTPASEPPGAQNGWNRTVFRYDPRLARELVVVEAPGAQNGWNRVVLRGGERPLAVLVLEWEIIP